MTYKERKGKKGKGRKARNESDEEIYVHEKRKKWRVSRAVDEKRGNGRKGSIGKRE
jgi:hypothetical protein